MKEYALPKFNIDDLDFSEFAAKFAPAMVPLAPMTVAIIGLAQGLQTGSNWAYIPAIVSGTGMELVGMLSAHLLTEAILKGNPGRVFTSSMLLLLYGGFAVWAISHTNNPGMYAAFVAMSVVGYLAGAAYKYNRQAEREKALAKDEAKRQEYDDMQKRRAELELEKERAELARQMAEQQERAERARLDHEERMAALRVREANAETRKAKAEHGVNSPKVSPAQTKVTESFGSWRNVPLEEREKIKHMNTRQIMEAYNVTERTAQNWQKYAPKVV